MLGVWEWTVCSGKGVILSCGFVMVVICFGGGGGFVRASELG